MDKKTGQFNRFINSTVILYIVLWLLQPVPNRIESDIRGIATYTMMDSAPGRVSAEIEIPFRRPRIRTELLRSKEYNFFKNNLLNVFYNESEEYPEENRYTNKIALYTK